MTKSTRTMRWVGMDVHAETIAIAVAEKDGTVHFVGTIPNEPDAIRRALKKLEKGGKLRACYEAGPTGYGLYWQLAEMGIECDVVAPTLIPVKAGDKVKTDRRDAEKLACAAVTSRQYGSPILSSRPCAIWFARDTPRSAINSGIVIGSGSFCFNSAFVIPRRFSRGERSTWCGSRRRRCPISRIRRCSRTT